MSGFENSQVPRQACDHRCCASDAARLRPGRTGATDSPAADWARTGDGTRYAARELDLTAQGVAVYITVKAAARWVRRPEQSIRAWASIGEVRTKQVPTWSGYRTQYNRIDCERAASMPA